MTKYDDIAHAKRHGAEAEDPWESGFFYGAAFALEEQLYDMYHQSLGRMIRIIAREENTSKNSYVEAR